MKKQTDFNEKKQADLSELEKKINDIQKKDAVLLPEFENQTFRGKILKEYTQAELNEFAKIYKNLFVE